MHKSDRLFQLTHLLLKRRPLSASGLARELDVSVRSVYRYINDLSAHGVPVYFDDEHQGYRLSEGYDLPVLSLNQEEFDALVTGVTLVKSWTGSQLASAAHSLLNKMKAINDNPTVEFDHSNVISPVFTDRRIQADHWDSVQQSIRQQCVIAITYQDEQQAVTQRSILPLGLAFWGGVWTIASWCFLRKSYRCFRLDRIQNLAECSTHRVDELPAYVSLNDYYQKCQFD